MTRKDYVKFAELVKAAKIRLRGVVTSPQTVVDFFTTEIADIFAADNPRFERERFEKACEEKEVDK